MISLAQDQIDTAWSVEKIDNIFVVTGNKIERFAARTDFSNPHGINRLRDIMKKLGIMHELQRQGAAGDSIVNISGHDFTMLEQ